MTDRTCSIAANANAAAAMNATSDAVDTANPDTPSTIRIALSEASALNDACIPTARR